MPHKSKYRLVLALQKKTTATKKTAALIPPVHADAKALSLASGRLGRVERVGKFTVANLEHFAAWNHFSPFLLHPFLVADKGFR